MNQDSYGALFCSGGGALKFAFAILDLYFLCYHVKWKYTYLSAYHYVTYTFDTGMVEDPDVKLNSISTNVDAQLIEHNDKQSAQLILTWY